MLFACTFVEYRATLTRGQHVSSLCIKSTQTFFNINPNIVLKAQEHNGVCINTEPRVNILPKIDWTVKIKYIKTNKEITIPRNYDDKQCQYV